MKLNFDYYKEDVLYNLGQNEKKIIEYINSNEPSEYKKIIDNDITEETLLGLSNIRENLVNLYDFEDNSTVLEIGAHLGELTGALCEKTKRVISVEFSEERAKAIAKRHSNKENLEIIVGKLQDIKFDEKFDYITLFGILEYAPEIYHTDYPALDLIKYCKALLKPQGKLLIATNNKFALKSYVGDRDECTNIVFDSITGYKSSKKQYKLGKNQLEEILKKTGLDYYKFLYVLPDYKLPSLIFSDEYLPDASKISNYFPYYRENSSIFYSEVDAYETILNENNKMFPFFSNSYFIEASQTNFINDTRYISFNNYRKEKYQLMTKIKEKTVEKTYVSEKSKKHLDTMIENVKWLKHKDIKILDEEQDEKIVTEFINGKTASQLIEENINNPEIIIKILERYKQIILTLSKSYDKKEDNIFNKYDMNVDQKILEKLNFLENGYWDMILKNCFIVDNEYIFFDQEWMEKNVPVEFLLYRSIINIEKLRSKIEEYDIYEKLGIKEFITIFEQLDSKIANEIMDSQIFSFYLKKHKNPIYDNYDLQKELDKTIDEKQEKVIELAEKSNQIEKITEEKGFIEKNNKMMINEIEKNKIEIKQLKEQLNNIYQSRSWKLLRKISKVKGLLKLK